MRRSIAFFICSAVYLWSAQGANALGLVGETAKPQWPCLAVDTGAQVACAPSSSILLSGLSDTVASSNSTCAEGQATEKICFIPENDNTDIFECFQCVSPKYSPQQAVDKNGESTWWQSSAVSSRKQAVTLRLDFPHEYLLTGVQVKFARSRPSAMRIQISDGADSGESLKWKSIAYYADNCSAHYRQTGQVLCRNFSSGMPGSRVLDVPIELSQLVTNKWDLIPRPAKEQLQKLILRRIRIVFDEIADMPMEQLDGLLAVLKSGDNLKSFGHYSVADFKVYGLCYCNGHAEQCNAKTGKCTCQHGTAGEHCQQCSDLNNDLPWMPATSQNPEICKACTCNGNTERCRFDSSVYQRSGNVSGGVCVDCQYHTHGQHCEECNDLYHRRQGSTSDGRRGCLPCDCNPYGTQQNRSGCDPATGQCLCANGYSGQQCETCKIELHYSAPAYHFSSTTTATVCRPCSCDTTGSLSPVCNGDGRCSCKAGVGGYKCAHCKDTYYNLTDTGCRQCDCDWRGTEWCDSHSGACFCKPGVKGTRCSQCVAGSRYTGQQAILGCLSTKLMVPGQRLNVQQLAILAVMVIAVAFIVAVGIFCIVRYQQKRKSESRLVRFASERVLSQSRPLDSYVADGPCIDSPSMVAQRHVSDCTVFENPLRSDESKKQDSTGERPSFRTRQSLPAIVGVNFNSHQVNDFSKRSSTPDIAMFLNEAFGIDPESDEETAKTTQKRRSRQFKARRQDCEPVAKETLENGGVHPRTSLQVHPPLHTLDSPHKAGSVKRAESFNTRRIAPPKPARSPMRSYSLRTTGSLPQLHASRITQGACTKPTYPGRSEAALEKAIQDSAVATPEPESSAQRYKSTPVLMVPVKPSHKPPQPPPVVVRRRELPRPPGIDDRQSPVPKTRSRVRSTPPTPVNDHPGSRSRSSTTPDQMSRMRSTSQANSPRPPPRSRRTPRRPRSNSLSALSAVYTDPRKGKYENWPQRIPRPASSCHDCWLDSCKAKSCTLSADSYDGNWEDSGDDVPALPDRTMASYQLYSSVAGVSTDPIAAKPPLPAPTNTYDSVRPVDPQKLSPAVSSGKTGRGNAAKPPPPPVRNSSTKLHASPEHPYETLKAQHQPPYASLVGKTQACDENLNEGSPC